MKYVLLIVVSTALMSGLSFAQDEPAVKEEKDRINYSVGYQIGGDFKRQGIELSAEMLVKGIQDAVSGAQPLMTQEEMSATLLEMKRKIIAFQREERQKISERNLIEGKNFLEENAGKNGVKVLPSGLQYRVITEGTGASPQATDTVTVHYRGTLIDGTEFDSSYSRNAPSTFQVDRVIRGWSEGLQLMKEGATWQLFIPPDLGYGDRVSGRIAPNSTLIFDVELISVKKGEGKN